MASPTSELGSSKAAELSAPKIAPDIIAESLKPFSIGEKLRTLRLRKKLGLVELGKHTGFSAALISKLERGKLYPTLPTLVRIAAVFNVGLEYFFNDERKRHVVAVVRKQERQRFPERPGTTDVSYFFEALDYPANSRKLSSYFADFQKHCPGKAETAHPPGSRTALYAGRNIGRHHRKRASPISGGRLAVFRFKRASHLLESRTIHHARH